MPETTYVLQNQSLIEQALPVFVGAFSAFIFSVVTLFIRNVIHDRSNRRRLLSNLSRELKYDLSVIADIKKNIDIVIPKILADENEPYFKLKYGKFLANFVQEAYRAGVLFELLSEYDIAVFDDVLNHYVNGGSEAWLRNRVESLKSSGVDKQDVIRSFQYEKDELDAHVRIIEDVLAKIEQYMKRNRH